MLETERRIWVQHNWINLRGAKKSGDYTFLDGIQRLFAWIELATACESSLFIELGVFRGKMGKMIADFLSIASSNFTYLGVDFNRLGNFKDKCWPRLFKNHIEHGNVWFYDGTIENVANILLCKAAFIFLDACHCYDCVLKDIELWKDNIVIGGYFVFHDTNPKVQHRITNATHGGIARPVEVRKAIEDSKLSETYKFIEETTVREGFQCYKKIK